jgi:hypothetical protein
VSVGGIVGVGVRVGEGVVVDEAVADGVDVTTGEAGVGITPVVGESSRSDMFEIGDGVAVRSLSGAQPVIRNVIANAITSNSRQKIQDFMMALTPWYIQQPSVKGNHHRPRTA